MKRFFSLFMESHKSILTSLMFLFFPTHDSTVYWFIAQYLTITISFYFFAYYLAHQNKLYLSFIFALLGSFVSYGSVPIALSLTLLFMLKNEFKKSMVLLIPNILYIIYYVYITKFLLVGTARLHENDLLTILKNYVLQVGTFIDSSIGLSFLLKNYYAVGELTIVSALIGVLIIILFYKYNIPKKEKVDKHLLFALVFMTFSSFGMFALTGYYPQISFNLGNRVTIYGALLVSFAIVMYLMNSKKTSTFIFAIFIFVVLGVSDHWKAWNKQQQQLIVNISNNAELETMDINKQLFVSYNQYSKLGDLSHIEFFAEGIPVHFFRLATKRQYKVSTLNDRFVCRDDVLLDKKYNNSILLDDVVYVYDSKLNDLLKIDKKNMQKYIEHLPKNNRHWIQFLDQSNFIMRIVLGIMPRLGSVLNRVGSPPSCGHPLITRYSGGLEWGPG